MKKMKNLLLLWVLLAIAVIIMSVNDFQLMPGKTIEVVDSAAGNVLFACPAADMQFDGVAAQLLLLKKGLIIVFSFFAMLWLAVTAWLIYQALLKDKFEKKSFELPIFLGKFLVFTGIAAIVLINSPNHFHRVNIKGMPGAWVLCENNSPGAKPVRKDLISAGFGRASK